MIELCQYDLAYVGPCLVPCTGRFCVKHQKEKCVSCGEQAIRQCPEALSLVCGYPLCAECIHRINGEHKKKRQKRSLSKDLKQGLADLKLHKEGKIILKSTTISLLDLISDSLKKASPAPWIWTKGTLKDKVGRDIVNHSTLRYGFSKSEENKAQKNLNLIANGPSYIKRLLELINKIKRSPCVCNKNVTCWPCQIKNV